MTNFKSPVKKSLGETSVLLRKAAADEKETHTDFRQDLLDGKRGKKITGDCQSHRAEITRQTHTQVKAEVKISLIFWRKAFHKYFLLSTIKREAFSDTEIVLTVVIIYLLNTGLQRLSSQLPSGFAQQTSIEKVGFRGIPLIHWF